jgi:hypothetical protein
MSIARIQALVRGNLTRRKLAKQLMLDAHYRLAATLRITRRPDLAERVMARSRGYYANGQPYDHGQSNHTKESLHRQYYDDDPEDENMSAAYAREEAADTAHQAKKLKTSQ